MEPTPVNMRNCQIKLSMHVKVLQTFFLKNVWPANSAFFIYFSTISILLVYIFEEIF